MDILIKYAILIQIFFNLIIPLLIQQLYILHLRIIQTRTFCTNVDLYDNPFWDVEVSCLYFCSNVRILFHSGLICCVNWLLVTLLCDSFTIVLQKFALVAILQFKLVSLHNRFANNVSIRLDIINLA